MCDLKSSSTNNNVTMVCKQSGKPITVTNKFGMFCEDLCDLQENKDAMKKLQTMFPGAF